MSSELLASVNATDPLTLYRRLSSQTVASSFQLQSQDQFGGMVYNRSNVNMTSISTPFGYAAVASGNRSVAVGAFANAREDSAVSMGVYALALGPSSVAIGDQTRAAKYRSISIGRAASSNGNNAIAIGTSSAATEDSVAIGNLARTFGLTLGYGPAYRNVAIGHNASIANVANAIAIGESATIVDTGGGFGGQIAIGQNTYVIGSAGIALGFQANVHGEGGIAIGDGAQAQYDFSIALGDAVTTTSANQMKIGDVGIPINVIVSGNLNLTDGIFADREQMVNGADPTGNFDASPAIQAAIDAASASTRRMIVALPQGKFKIETKLVISKPGVTFRGASAVWSQGDLGIGTVLVQGSSGMTVLEVSDNGSGVFPENIVLADFGIIGNGNVNAANVGLSLFNIHNTRVSNVRVASIGGGVGISIRDETYQLSFYNVQAYFNVFGYRILGGVKGNGTNADNINFYNCHFLGNSTANGFLAAGNAVFNDWGGKYEGSKDLGAQSNYGLQVTGGMLEVNLHNTYFEQNLIADLDIYKCAATGTATARLDSSALIGARSMNVWGCHMHGGNNPSPADNGGVAINARGANRVTIIGLSTDTHNGGGTGGAPDAIYGVADPSPINFCDTGLTNGGNTNNLLINPRLNEAAGLIRSVSTSVTTSSGSPLTVLQYADASDAEAFTTYVAGGGGFRRPYTITQAWNPGAIANDGIATTTVGISGGGGSVAGGTESSVSVSYTGITAAGWIISANVIDANTVSVLIWNKTGGSLTPTGTLRIEVWRH